MCCHHLTHVQHFYFIINRVNTKFGFLFNLTKFSSIEISVWNYAIVSIIHVPIAVSIVICSFYKRSFSISPKPNFFILAKLYFGNHLELQKHHKIYRLETQCRIIFTTATVEKSSGCPVWSNYIPTTFETDGPQCYTVGCSRWGDRVSYSPH